MNESQNISFDSPPPDIEYGYPYRVYHMKRQVNVTLDDELFRRFRMRTIEQRTSALGDLGKIDGGVSR